LRKELAGQDDDAAQELKQTLDESIPTPEELLNHLNNFVIGQEDAKKVLSVAVYNHYQRLRQNEITDSKFADVEIEKANILLLGPTGAKMLKTSFYASSKRLTLTSKKPSVASSTLMRSTRSAAKPKTFPSLEMSQAKECSRPSLKF